MRVQKGDAATGLPHGDMRGLLLLGCIYGLVRGVAVLLFAHIEALSGLDLWATSTSAPQLADGASQMAHRRYALAHLLEHAVGILYEALVEGPVESHVTTRSEISGAETPQVQATLDGDCAGLSLRLATQLRPRRVRQTVKGVGACRRNRPRNTD